MERRTLIRLLVIVGIGIPLLVEGITFFGLIGSQFLGGSGTPTPGPGTPTATPLPGAVAQGEEILPETPQNDTLTTASIDDGGQVLTLTVSINNTGNAPYELSLGPVTTDSGETVGGTVSTGEIPPGESGFATGQWTLPRDTRFVSVTVVAEDGETRRIERTVPLDPTRK